MRYFAEREHGSDWCICEYIKGRKVVKATGLDEDEARETADQWNQNNDREKSNYVG